MRDRRRTSASGESAASSSCLTADVPPCATIFSAAASRVAASGEPRSAISGATSCCGRSASSAVMFASVISTFFSAQYDSVGR
jgi:hypothetical protein